MTIHRLTSTDLINLYVETPSTPARVGALAILEPGAGVGWRIDGLRAALGARLDGAPQLRKVIHRGGIFGGRPVWVDDPVFSIERHVGQVVLAAGRPLNDLAMELVNRPFDTAHPLWRLCFVTGLPGGRIGMVLAMHHVMADGATAVRLIDALLDAGDVPGKAWRPRKPPAWHALFLDNVREKVSSLKRIDLGALASWRLMAGGLWHASPSSLNHPVGAHRRLAAFTWELSAVKNLAHRYGAKVNDVVLSLAAGGIRELLRARGEPVDGVCVNVSLATSLRVGGAQGRLGNRTGVIVVRVPLVADHGERLRLIARASAEAKTHQFATAGNALLVALARIGLLRRFSRRQHMINVVESNVVGPPETVTLLGARVTDIVPIGTLVGNVSLGFLALSYAGRLTLAVQADAGHFPDLQVLLDAVEMQGPRPGRLGGRAGCVSGA